jgi:NitT/TauT family transport system substrate-binding protein
MRRILPVAAIATVATIALSAGCSSSSSGSAGAGGGQVTLRLGFLANITHAPALVGVEKGIFAKALGKNVTLKVQIFNTGTEEATALLAGQLDAAYVGPNPAVNAWLKSGGKAIKIISGAATGGASVVVKKGITSAAQLKGKSLATPSLGNTQDVALRYWLKQHGLSTNATGGGDVSIKPTKPNSAAVLEFQSGQIQGASEPSPYDVEMIKAGGTRLFAESGVTTLLVAAQTFLAQHASVISGLLKGQIQANDYIAKDPAAAQAAANAELTKLLGKGIKSSILPAAFKEITFTNNPDAASLAMDAKQAQSVGLLSPVNLTGIYDLGPLNALLKAAGEPQVSS